MEQINGSICAPLGFSVAGTYSGVCNRRVKLDLAMIMSRSDCSIVTFGKDLGNTQCSSRVLLYHNGLSLTANKRADEITSEICQAAADHAAVAPEQVTLLTTGLGGQYFRPSLVINSINALVASLSGHHDDLVENVMDNGSDVLSGAVSFHAAAGKGSLGGILAEGTADAAGLCLLTTDVAVTAEQVQQALEKNGDIFDLQGYNVIVMSNSLAASPAVSNGDLLAQAMQQLLEQLGVPAMLKVCS